jgi:hypothetical protein
MLKFVIEKLPWFEIFLKTKHVTSQSVIYQLMHNRVALKNIKIYIKTAPTCSVVWLQLHHRTAMYFN